MCFSAGASFSASAILSVIGVVILKKTKKPEQIPFASIPFIFGIQQFSEGLVWLALSHPSLAFLEKASSYTFLIFAQVVWPLYVPLSVMLLEKNIIRKKLIIVFVGIGILVSSYFAYRLIRFGVHANITGYHVAYKQVYTDHWNHIADLFYGIATIIPIFLSKVKKMWIFGLSISISYVIAAIVYVNFILSVWCFFAAVISIIIYFIINELPSKNSKYN